jgi:WD40 repeat protein
LDVLFNVVLETGVSLSDIGWSFAFCWSPAGSDVISGDSGGRIRIWNTGGQCLRTIHNPQNPQVLWELYVASSADSSLIAFAFSGDTHPMVNIFDVDSGNIFQTVSVGRIRSIRFSNRNELMYTTSSTFAIQDLTKNANVLMFTYDGGEFTATSSDGIHFASCDAGTVNIWQTNITTQQNDVINACPMLGHIAFFGDGKLVALDSSNGVEVWDTTTGFHIFTGQTSISDSVAFSPDCIYCAFRASTYTIQIWDICTHTLVSTIKYPPEAIRFSPNGTELLSIRSVWNRKGGSIFGTLTPITPIHRVANELRKELFGTRQLQSHVDLFEVRTGKCIASIVENGLFNMVDAVFNIDGNSITLLKTSNQSGRIYQTPVNHTWRISPAASTYHSLPMEFFLIHTEKLVFPDGPPP